MEWTNDKSHSRIDGDAMPHPDRGLPVYFAVFALCGEILLQGRKRDLIMT